ncbi:MAG: class I SAM-dependent methyltransferase [Anaerolineales bacterium]
MTEFSADELHINHRYVLTLAAHFCRERENPKILDYGCGAAQTVAAGRRQGLEIFGADIFYAGSNDRQVVEKSGLFGTIVREIRNGRIDFPDGYFDFVFSNQVLEHVEDLEGVLAEIRRVLKPDGRSVHLFPSRDVWREGHCGIPFLHWFSKDSPVRYPYALSLRLLGLGKFKRVDPKGWTRRMLDFLDEYCVYRNRAAIFAAFRKYFDFELIEDDYIYYRLGETRLHFLRPLIRWPVIKPIAKEMFRKLGGLVLLASPTTRFE